MTEIKHRSFWDCIENDSTKEIAHRLTPKAICDKIKVYECRKCGKKHVLEFWFYQGTKEVSETNRYGFSKQPEKSQILEDYKVE